jgi:RND superfamily putative drug exporter
MLGQYEGHVPNAAVLLISEDHSVVSLDAAASSVQRRLAATPSVRRLAEPLPRKVAGAPALVLPLVLSGNQDQRIETAVTLRTAIHSDETRAGVRTYLVGQDSLWAALHKLSTEELTSAETIGLPVTLILLLAIFGALAAAFLPLVLAGATVVITGAIIFFLSHAISMSLFVTNSASMVGVGVAVDYSLFVLARYREAIRQGADKDAALALAMRTSGVAVTFSGLTVVVSLLALFLVNSVTLRSMAVGMIVIVALSVLGVTTLIPALISVLGDRVSREGRIRRLTRRLRPGRTPVDSEDFWSRWSRRVMRRPVLSALGAVTVMLVLALPALSISLGENAIGLFPKGNAARVGAEVAYRTLGPAAVAPLTEVATFKHGTALTPEHRHAVAEWASALEREPGVSEVLAPETTPDRRSAVLTIRTTLPPESTKAEALLARLRDQADDRSTLAAQANISIGGDVALNRDFVTLIEHSMWKIALFILILSYLILLVMLRSVLLPLKALLMTLLSVASACGVLVVVFKWGWFDHLLGEPSPGHVDSLTPPLLLTLVFGLSMDYEVFMLSRIREAYRATEDTEQAVAVGLRRCAGPVTSAALIMVSVFLAFAWTSVPSIRQLGTGLAVAIALDATIVRLVLVPSAMQLLGRWNWWFPDALSKRLPRPSAALTD